MHVTRRFVILSMRFFGKRQPHHTPLYATSHPHDSAKIIPLPSVAVIGPALMPAEKSKDTTIHNSCCFLAYTTLFIVPRTRTFVVCCDNVRLFFTWSLTLLPPKSHVAKCMGRQAGRQAGSKSLPSLNSQGQLFLSCIGTVTVLSLHALADNAMHILLRYT